MASTPATYHFSPNCVPSAFLLLISNSRTPLAIAKAQYQNHMTAMKLAFFQNRIASVDFTILIPKSHASGVSHKSHASGASNKSTAPGVSLNTHDPDVSKEAKHHHA